MTPIRVPFLGANDSEGILLAWTVDSGSQVSAGHPICTVETTKTVIEVAADVDGIVHPTVLAGSRVAVGDAIGIIAADTVADPATVLATIDRPSDAGSPPARATRKAAMLLSRHGLTEDDAAPFASDGRVTEEIALAAIAHRRREDGRRGFGPVERIGVVGSVSGGGALIVIDSLLRGGKARAAAVFDRDPATHGREILGVPVVGDSAMAAEWCREGRIDAIVLAFNRDLVERQRMFEQLDRDGARFCNIIDPTAEVRSGVRLGRGNVLLGRVYLGACCELGDNNFISGGVWLEHGNRVGSHCAFGPGVATSGNVTIGDRVRFGTGIFLEPGLRIGDDAVVASGAIVTGDIPDRHVLRVDYAQSLHPLGHPRR